MSTYAIGDIHGCYDELILLLEKINFDEANDTLWFVGDLVNRGPKSLEVLRFVKELDKKHIVVLGNHDLHLLAVAEGFRTIHHGDTFQDILNAPDKEDLLAWVREKNLLHWDNKLNFVMTHAGIYPLWSLEQAQGLAKELAEVIHGEEYREFLAHMYGDKPDSWSEDLKGWERYRFILNALVRMRYVDSEGRLDMQETGPIGSQPSDLVPWFKCKNRKPINFNLVFGHWASLEGVTDRPNIFATDTGCVWGRALTAIRLEDQRRFSVTKL